MRVSTVILLISVEATLAFQKPHEAAVRERELRLRPSEEQRAAPPIIPNGYALIIGIATYQNGAVSPLNFSETDADAIYRVLISAEGGAFPAENVHRLIGKEATLDRIRSELEEWLPAVAKDEDRVIVYFAGHGIVENGRGYIAAWDTDPARIAETGYPMQSLGNTLANKVRARWKALFTDACHSGKINAETTNETVLQELNASASQFLSFAATIGREKSYEDPGLSTGFGLFSYFLAQGLRGNADHDPCDGVVTADELVEYVRTEVRQYAKSRGVQQTPHAASDYDPEMALGVSQRCGPNGAQAPASGSAVVQTEAEDVDVYVDERFVGRATRGAPLSIPGLATGSHVIRAVKKGYKPEVKEFIAAPGRQTPITLQMRYPMVVKPSALEFGTRGERLLYTARSTINPLNVLPVARNQSRSDLVEAKELFTRALAEDPSYSMAAYHLGVTNQLLSDDPGSKAAFKQAIEADPNFIAARLQLGGVLIESGDTDEAIRQFTEALRLDPENDEAHAQLALAYWHKAAWPQCIEQADAALSLKAENSMAHLWRGDCLRQTAAAQPAGTARVRTYEEARESYRAFTRLTNFSTSALEWAAFHFVGFHLGSRRHADRKDSYDNLRGAAFLGLCLCDQRLGNLLRAQEYCKRAIKHLPDDAIAHFVLGSIQRDLFNQTRSCAMVAAARASYVRVVDLNPSLAEARNARHYIEQIDGMQASLRKLGCR